MVRRNFIQVLQEGKIDIKNEYSKLYSLFYGKSEDNKSLADFISLNFTDFHFCGTCLSLEEFDNVHDIFFEEQPQEFDIDYLVNFCEYIYNFIFYFDNMYFFASSSREYYLEHIHRVIEVIGYKEVYKDGFYIFVPKDNVSMSVSELETIPEKISYKIIEYNHHSMKGDIERKHHLLNIFANILEPKRKELENIDKVLTNDLFYAFNNFNIRHNNVDVDAGTKYKKVIAMMTDKELETWYDEVYQMSLLAFMLLENDKRKQDFDLLKKRIENN